MRQATHSQRPRRCFLENSVVEHDAGGQDRDDDCGQVRPRDHRRATAQPHAKCEQSPADHLGDGQRNAAGGNRPLGPLGQIDPDVENVVQRHAGGVNRGRGTQQETKYTPIAVLDPPADKKTGMREYVTECNIGHRSEQVRQPQQLGVRADERKGFLDGRSFGAHGRMSR